ncbi:MAG: DHHA1 domain-containing protein [Anaerolineae bacterium]
MKKYWDDSYTFSFESRIIDVTEQEGRLGLVLQDTYFFPEGGGQPSDRGSIASRPVVGVEEVGDTVIHFLEYDEEADKRLRKGMIVSCDIDKEFRLHNMRIHSACHVLFGAARKLFPSVNYAGFHIGELGNLYLETGQQITANELRKIELIANECVVHDRPIKTFWVTSKDAAHLDRLAYNIELPRDEPVRIVEVEDWDIAACSGTHLHRSVEIGPIKIVARESHRKNVTRIDYAIGKRAIAEFAEDERIVAETATLLGTSKDQLTQVVRKMASELQSDRKRLRKLRELLVGYKVQELLQSVEAIGGVQLIIDSVDYLDSKSIQAMVATIVSERESVIAAIIGVDDQLTVVAGCSQDVNISLSEPIVRIAEKYGGGGGGRANLVTAGGIRGSFRAVRDEVEMELKQTLHRS